MGQVLTDLISIGKENRLNRELSSGRLSLVSPKLHQASAYYLVFDQEATLKNLSVTEINQNVPKILHIFSAACFKV